MPSNYYYLVSGLPDIIMDGMKKGISWIDTVAEIREQLSPADAGLLCTLQYPYDNRNCIALLEKRDEFDPRGCFPKEIMLEEIKSPEAVPDYMNQFIEACREDVLPFPGLLPADQLAWLFYDEMARHPNAFIREWYSFDLNLRNFLAGTSARLMKESGRGELAEQMHLSRIIIGNNDAAEQIRRSNAPDFGLALEYDWIEDVMPEEGESLLEIEKNIDLARWSMLDQLTVFSYFEVETILAFCLKFAIAVRWLSLDAETGRELLEKLMTATASDIQIA